MAEEKDSSESNKKNWKDYFDVFKYFIPFFVYFLIIWLDANYASNDELTEVKSAVSSNTVLAQSALEENKDLKQEVFYEIKLIDTKLLAISEDIAEIKKIVEKKHQTE